MTHSAVFLAIVAVLVLSTEANKNCEKQARTAKEAGKTPPTCNGKLFAPKQCGADTCYCVMEKNGKQLYKSFEFPKSEDYDCSKKPTPCISERYDILVSGKEIAAPECDANGDYKKEVCKMVPSDNNIALDKPTMQSSEGWGGVSSRAVDGDKNPSWGGASCTITHITSQAWWAVDLGSETQVNSVIITNRDDWRSERLTNFRVGLTDNDPRTSAPTLDSYTPCATVPGSFGAGETRSLECSGKGRFLVVQLQGRNYLTLCEVEVFGDQKICE